MTPGPAYQLQGLPSNHLTGPDPQRVLEHSPTTKELRCRVYNAPGTYGHDLMQTVVAATNT